MPVNGTVPIKKGTLGPFQKPYTLRFDPRSGQTLKLKNLGNTAALLSLVALAQSQGATGDFTVDPVLSTLETETPIQGITINGVAIAEYVFDQWEIETNESSESVFGDPRVQANISSNDRAVIARAIADRCSLGQAASRIGLGTNDQGNPGDNIGANWPSPVTTFVAPTAGQSLQLYNEMMKMQDAWGPFTYVLRHTSNTNAQSTYNVADNNVNQIYTTAQLLSEVQSGFLWTYPIPSRLVTKILNIPVQYAETNEAAYYLWGWKKSASREQINAQFRVDIVTEYVLALWSTIRYAPI
jgi:hypothetical protein